MLAEALFLAAEFLIHGTILLVLLWIMIKLQKLDFNFLGLLGSAALGSGLDMIPHFGHYLAVPVLYLCVWKATRSNIFPEAAFTVVIAYAVMFCLNLFVLGALIGNLRPADKGMNETEKPVPKLVATTNSIVRTNVMGKVFVAAPVSSTNFIAAEKIVRKFTIKGVTRNADQSSVTLQSGKKVYTIFLGESDVVQTDDGQISVRFTDLGDDWAALTLKGAEVRVPLGSP
jgi:hypothetical protein